MEFAFLPNFRIFDTVLDTRMRPEQAPTDSACRPAYTIFVGMEKPANDIHALLKRYWGYDTFRPIIPDASLWNQIR